ncbi:NlpC/P60 family protein [Rhizobium sp. SL42]|uniref:NlpC/P60 family protein n=1 Tax=Rhizobium sp. SL42 TaxID=2806346 RepID=UPI001F4274A6|nr:NlpC/P60 family protein [Rhizobium sp. SL42]UJW76557.1 C40 family peptidase [Rhizobium sp. SL42]
MSINARVLGIAEQWIGTPYRHQGSAIGVGCDCLGLVRGIWRELYGCEPERVPAYAADWAERSGEERLLEAAGRHFEPVVSRHLSLPGDLVIFRFRPGCAAKHAGILAGPGGSSNGVSAAGVVSGARSPAWDAPDHFIHAYEQAAVIRSTLVPAWRRRIAGVYRFPEV